MALKDGWNEFDGYRVYVENGKVTIKDTYTMLVFDGIEYLLRETFVPEDVPLLWPYNLFRAIAADSDRHGDVYGGRRWEWLRMYMCDQVDLLLGHALDDAKSINKSARLKREWLERLEAEGDTCNQDCNDCIARAFLGECVAKEAEAQAKRGQ